jgi:hypothetical protein
VGVAMVLAGCSGAAKSVAPTPPAVLRMSLSAAENFFATQGTSGWSMDTRHAASDYQVRGTADTSCEVTISGPSGSSAVSSIGVVCNPLTKGTIAISVPTDQVSLVTRAVKTFDPDEYSEVEGIRTTASSSQLVTAVGHGKASPAVVLPVLSLRVDSSPPPGSNFPVLNLSIHAVRT